MLITFLASSRITPNLATRYCAGSVDAEGRTREEVRVIRGSPQQFEQIAMGLSFREKYKSAVLAFAPGDDPSDEDLNTLLDEFEQLCFAGLDVTRFCLVAYLHKTTDKTDVHVLIANVDLLTGKHFNAAPPGWQRDFDPLRDVWNWHKGWARPDDPRRGRAPALHPGPPPPCGCRPHPGRAGCRARHQEGAGRHGDCTGRSGPGKEPGRCGGCAAGVWRSHTQGVS